MSNSNDENKTEKIDCYKVGTIPVIFGHFFVHFCSYRRDNSERFSLVILNKSKCFHKCADEILWRLKAEKLNTADLSDVGRCA